MNICIVTVYDSINCGSFLQAYMLGKKCESLGHNVYYLRRPFKYRCRLNMSHFKKRVKLLITRGIRGYLGKRKIDKVFKKWQKKLKTIEKDKVFKMDYIVIGSDTLWNVNTDYFKQNYKLFFGGEFTDKRTFTYAISAANTSLNEILTLPHIKNYINNFYRISVRDKATQEIARELSKKMVELVCDPTLLFDKNEYISIMSISKVENEYIYLYLFDDLSKEQIKNVKQFAKDNNLTIVDGNLNKKWADLSICNTPENFLNYMYNADYVITDTFHGTIFATNFNKQFAVINRNKNKVNEFLNVCDLNDRLVNEQNLLKVLNRNITYKEVNKRLEDYRKKSEIYLENALKM